MQNEKSWLTNSHNSLTNIEKVKQLLLSRDYENIELAFQLLKSGGIPIELENLVKEWVFMCIEYDFKGIYEQITSLDLGYWDLKEVPMETFKLINLKTLSLKSNALSYLPKKILEFSKLEILQLYKNKISFLPIEIKYLYSLRRLDISYNQIRVLPKEIGALSDLEILNLSFNQLGKTKFPDNFARLHKLRKLDLKANGLYKIPPVLKTMKNLKEVFFNYNNLTTHQILEFQENLPNTKIHYHNSF